MTLADLSAVCEVAQAYDSYNDEMQLETKYPLVYKWMTQMMQDLPELKAVTDQYIKVNRFKPSNYPKL
jgi:glutathione S-transferase